MKKYRVKAISLLKLIILAIVSEFIFLFVAEMNMFNRIYLLMQTVAIIYLIILFFSLNCYVDEEKIMVKSLFQSRSMYWKDVKAIMLTNAYKSDKKNLYLLKKEALRSKKVINNRGIEEEIEVKYARRDAIAVSYATVGFEEVCQIIYDKFKTNEQVYMDKRFMDFVKRI